MVTANATIRPVADGRFELVLKTEVADARGTKTDRARSCTALAEAAAVFVALTIDSSTTSAPPASAEPAPAPPAPEGIAVPVVVSPAPHRAPSPPRRSREGLGFVGGVGAAVDIGTLPSASLGLTVNVQLRAGRVRAGVLGIAWLPQQATFDEARGAGASFQMFGAGLFGCYVIPLGQFELGPCANVEATSVRASGIGIRNPMVARSLWPTVVAGVLGGVRLTRWLGVVARVDLLTALGAPNVALATSRGNVPLYGPATVSVRSGAGLEIMLP
jgi:hypothetical protein